MALKEIILDIRKLSICQADKLLVDLSFKIYEEEVVGIVGSSGAGKSLTAKALAGILSDDLRCILDCSPKPTLGYVFQDPLAALNPLMSIGRQITEVTKDPQKTEAILRDLKLAGTYFQVPYQLSGGMRQRVVIAIALAQNPRLLICDEATSSLDAITQEEILNLLQKIQQEKRFSMVFITHDWSTVLKMCQRVIVMDRGLIVEEGETAKIYSDPKDTATQRLIEACAPF